MNQIDIFTDENVAKKTNYIIKQHIFKTNLQKQHVQFSPVAQLSNTNGQYGENLLMRA